MSPVHSLLKDRASMFQKVRSFFDKRDVTEVDVPHLLPKPQIDAHIDVIEVDIPENQKGFLHTSPEYMMKQLLAKGSKDIYQIAHVFRKEEVGRDHNIEFTMIEWYRIGMSLSLLIEEVIDLLSLFLGSQKKTQTSYHKLFQKYLQIDSLENQDLRNQDLDYLFSHKIQPHLGTDGFDVITDFPTSKAELSQICEKKKTALRFEIFYQGKELANGYQELLCEKEHRKRFQKQNLLREEMGKKPYELDENFLNCLKDLPECCGVSVGFDRLMMLKRNQKHLKDIFGVNATFEQ